uniref:histone acetyltransferase n=1 Tax=Biomphalaria glabrata TaxID=6526 RepID=A0A2C9K538_BIOGL
MVKETDKTVEVNATYLEWILEAVHKIKHQKQRPNKDRIINAIRQNHQVTEESILEQLELSVQNGKLLRVENNNDYTYKDPALQAPVKSQAKTLELDKKTDLTKLVIQCLKQSQEPKGMMLKSIERYIHSKYTVKGNESGVLMKNLRTCVRRAIQQKKLVQVGKFVQLAIEEGKVKESPPVNLADVEVVLPFERNRKKATPLPLCSFCLEGADKNREGKWEDLISCADCGSSGHPSCLKFSSELTAKVRKLRWQCINCKKCSFCGKSGKEDDMLFCDFCDRGFHMACCDPPIIKPPKGDWKCNLCDPERGTKKGKTFLEAAMLYTVNIKSQIQATSKQKLKKARLLQAAKKMKLKKLKVVRKKPVKSESSEESEHEDASKCEVLSPSEFALNGACLETLSILPETKHLVDGLSRFFTPSNKRSSRVSLSAIQPPLLGLMEENTNSSQKMSYKKQSDRKSTRTTSAHQTASRLIKRSKLVQASRGRKKTGGPPLSGQLRGLFDGLSEFFNATGERKRALPVYTSRTEPSSNSLSGSNLTCSSCTSCWDSPKALHCDGQCLNVCISDSCSKKSDSALSSRRHLSWWEEMNNLMQMTLQEFRQYGSQDGFNKGVRGRRTCLAQRRVGRLEGSQMFRDTIRTKAGMILPTYVTEEDVTLFKQAQEMAQRELDKALPKPEPKPSFERQSETGEDVKPVVETPRYPPCIEMGQFEIQTWYSSPYPQEYASLPKLYICEYCLKYMKSGNSLRRHIDKCELRHPPADEIYRNKDLSVFEVDGQTSKLYCQNLCLLAKLFLDHKTLYYDVEPFLFYVLTLNDDYGSHIVGYFSKEKHCQQKYNVSCIMTMPQYMRKGYGRLLIDFSYLLSRREECFGSPEKPLSALGAVSYMAYWRSIIFQYFSCHRDKAVSIRNISEETGLCPLDILQTLKELHFLKQDADSKNVQIAVNYQLVDTYMDKLKNKPHLKLNEDNLHWTPVVSKSFLSDEEDEADRQLNEMRNAVENVVQERKQLTEQLHKSSSSIGSPPVNEQTDKWPRRFGRKRFPSMTWGDPALKRQRRDSSNEESNKCPFDFDAEEDAKMLPPAPPLKQLRIDRSPIRASVSSCSLSPLSPSPFRPSYDSPVKTPEKKCQKKNLFDEQEEINGKKIEQRRKPGRPPKDAGWPDKPVRRSKEDRSVDKKSLTRKAGRPTVKENVPRKLGRPFKRKPGRPPKKQEVDEESNAADKLPSEKEGNKACKIPGRRPGRPRKAVDVSNGKVEEENVPSPVDEQTQDNTSEEKKPAEKEQTECETEFLPAATTPSLSPAPKKSKVIEEYIDSSSSSDTSDSSNSDSSDSDDEEDDNDGDNDDSDEEDNTPKVKSDVESVNKLHANVEMMTKVRRLSASSSDDDSNQADHTNNLSQSKPVLESPKEEDSVAEKQTHLTPPKKQLSESDSDSDESVSLKLKETLSKEPEINRNVTPVEDEETKAASQNLADIVKDLEEADEDKKVASPEVQQQASVESDVGQESSSFGSIDELTDALSDADSPTDPQIPSSPPPAPAPVMINSDDDDDIPMEPTSPSPERRPLLQQSSEAPINRLSDPLLSSPPQHHSTILSSPQQHSAILSSPPQHHSNLGHNTMSGMFPNSPILISPSPEVKPGQHHQPPCTPNQQIHTPSSHEDQYQNVGSVPLTSPVQHPSPVHLTSPAHLTSPSQLSSPVMSGSLLSHQEKHLTQIDTSPGIAQSKAHTNMGLNAPSRASKSTSSRTQPKSRSQTSSQSRVQQGFHASSSSGPTSMTNLQSMQQQNYELNVAQLGLASAASLNSGDMTTDSSQHSSLTQLNYDCAQNMQYCSNKTTCQNWDAEVFAGHWLVSVVVVAAAAQSSTPIPMVVQQALLQGGTVYQTSQQPNNCDLIKLQQLTNRIQDLPVESLQMTPPQNMTPPPATINMTPPPTVMMRSMTTPPISAAHSALMGQPTAPPYKRQRSTSSTSRKAPSVATASSPNVTLNPNMSLSPNVTIQPTSSMIPGYLNYRVPQGMINPNYISANPHRFLQPQQLPMQMQMMNMNVHAAGPPAAFQQQVQSSQPGNPTAVYTPYYINMNNVMRR